MVGHAMDRGGLKDSENASNSFFPKINRTGFWDLGTDMVAFYVHKDHTEGGEGFKVSRKHLFKGEQWW